MEPCWYPRAVNGAAPAYAQPDSEQTLREALDEYFRQNPKLLDPGEMPDGAAALFRQHDAGHCVFACDNSLRGETLIDTWTIFATTAGVRGYLEYFEHPEVNQVFADVGFVRIVWEFLKALPDVARVLGRSWRQPKRWTWAEWEAWLDTPLHEIREHFGIRVV